MIDFVATPRAELPAALRARLVVTVDGEARGLITAYEGVAGWTWLVIAAGQADFRAGHGWSEEMCRLEAEVAAREFADLL